MCNNMYENVKSFDYTKKSLQSDSDPATMEMVTQTNAVKSPTNSPETTCFNISEGSIIPLLFPI